MSHSSKDRTSSRHTSLRPCREVIQQIQWDQRFDTEKYIVHYEERFAGLRAVPLTEFLGKSEIPWHRIRRITQRIPSPDPTRDTQEKIAWDRDQRIDQLTPCTDTNAGHPSQCISLPPTHHSALAIIPPTSIWPQIQAIRQHHDRSFQRWMPHINLIYGFIPDREDNFSQASALIQRINREHQLAPFRVSLNRIDRFRHRNQTTIWLQPDTDDNVISTTREALLPGFPLCGAPNHAGTGYTPHLTIAKISHNQHPSATELMEQWQREWQSIHFDVSSLHLISREADTPFSIQAEIPLGQRVWSMGWRPSHNPHSHTLSHTTTITGQTEIHQHILAAWTDLLEAEDWALLCEEPHTNDAELTTLADHTLVPYGSHALGTVTPTSDLDLLCLAPEGYEIEDTLIALQQHLQTRAPAWQGRIARAYLTTLKLTHPKYNDVDITCARLPLGLWGHPPTQWLPVLNGREICSDIQPMTTSQTFSEEDKKAMQGALDADTLNSTLSARGITQRFGQWLPLLKHWAKARDLDNAAIGYIGGFGWSVIAAWWCQQSEAHTNTNDELALFFATMATRHWHQPISVTTVPEHWQPHPKRDRLPILTPAETPVNITRSVTQSTQETLRREWQRAATLLQTVKTPDAHNPVWQEVCQPIECPEEQHLFIIDIDANTRERDSLQGWLKGQAVGLLLQLEKALAPHPQLTLRPYNTTPLSIGIRNAQNKATLLDNVATKANAWLQAQWTQQHTTNDTLKTRISVTYSSLTRGKRPPTQRLTTTDDIY